MAILDIFKKGKEEKAPEKSEKKPEVLEQKPAKPKEKKKTAKKTDKIDGAKKTDSPILKPKKRNYSASHEVLHSPHITEKATDATDSNKYIFKVGVKANKIEVKKAVESTYGVNVTAVNVINIHRKKRRVGRNIGWAKGYKKAIVSVKKGEKIEIMPR